MSKIQVSVIMPAYNAEKHIARSVQSVLDQTFTQWELIIVDDGSVDATGDIVKGFALADKRITYLHQENSKQGKARNEGILFSSGVYIAFLDADDIWFPKKLEKQIVLINETNSDMVSGLAYFIEDETKTVNVTGRGSGLYKNTEAIKLLLDSNAFVISTVLMKRGLLEKVGCFTELPELQNLEDWHLWLKVALCGASIYAADEVITYYRLTPNSSINSEKRFRLKCFYTFENLLLEFPNRSLIAHKSFRLAEELLIHEPELSVEMSLRILACLKSNKIVRFTKLYLFLFFIHPRLFRKLVLYRIA